MNWLKQIIILVRDLFLYPFDADKEHNKFQELLTFLFKEYPAFLRMKPSIRRILLFPFLLGQTIFQSKSK